MWSNWKRMGLCFYLDPGAGGGGASGGGAGGGGDPPKPPDNKGDNPPAEDKTGTGDGSDNKPDKVTFTPDQQEYLNKLVGEARTKGREQAKKEAEEAQKKSAEEAEKKRLEEQKEWQKLAEKRAQEVADAQRERDELSAAFTESLIRAEVRVQAAQLGFENPDDAYDLADLASVQVDIEKSDVEGIKEALEALAKEKPYLLKKQHGGGIGTPRPVSSSQPQEQRAPSAREIFPSL
ncbi:MAG: hypothetical protein JXA14_26355 [Anaerolineae bacterium]|nr:hypothetical protein [Anaerolineae bacterium]